MRRVHVVMAAISVSLVVSAAAGAPVVTQIVPDTLPNRTMGTTVTLPDLNNNYTVNGGLPVGTNLFHSFSDFSVGTGATVTFGGSATNIISRVTGGHLSQIDGKIISGANLYLVNPSGIMFGPNATLEVSGSFYATTADYLKLRGTGYFYATTPEKTVLTADPPSAFGFLGSTKPAPITVTDSNLLVPTGALTLVGGDLTVTNNTTHTVLSGHGGIDLVSVGSAGEAVISDAGIDTSSFTKMGTATVTKTNVLNPGADISTSGGRIFISAGSFIVDKGRLTSNETNEGDAGNVTIAASDVTIKGLPAGGISTSSSGGKGGDIDIEASGFVTLDLGYLKSGTSGSKDAGKITVTAQRVNVENGGRITADSDGSGNAGNAGNVSISAPLVAITSTGLISANSASSKGGNINITASSSIVVSGTQNASSSITSNSHGSKDAGTVTLTSPIVTLENNGQINVSSTGSGMGGDVHIIGDQVSLLVNSTIFDQTNGPGSGGTVTIDTGTLTVSDSKIAVESFGPGNGNGRNIIINAKENVSLLGKATSLATATVDTQNAGNISITAPTVTIDGAKINLGQYSKAGTGNAGDLTISATDVAIRNGAQLSTNSAESKTGDINIVATNSVTVSGSVKRPTTISSSTSGSKDAGSISISTSTMSVTGNGSIIANSSGAGKAGDVSIKTGSLALDSGSRISTSTSTSSTGQGGTISITADNAFSLDGGFVTAGTAGSGRGGDITVEAADVVMANSGTITASTTNGGDGGNIQVITDRLNMTKGASIEARAGNVGDAVPITGKGGFIHMNARESATISGSYVDVSTAGKGDAGTLTIETPSLSLSGKAQISSNSTSEGNAGSITIKTASLTIDDATVNSGTSRTGKAGGITVNTDVLTMADGGGIETSSGQQSQGQGGHIDITATDQISITGNATTIATDTAGAGDAGSILVTAPSVNITDGGSISARSSATGNAGSIVLHIADQLDMDGGRITTEAAQATGGNITIEPSLVDMRNSTISTSVNGGFGNGGNVSLSAGSLVLQNSSITANAIGGNGGSVHITANAFVSDPESFITASSEKGLPGTVDINAPLVDVNANLVQLPQEILKEELTPRTCAAGDSFSSFIVGTSSLRYRPDTDLLAF